MTALLHRTPVAWILTALVFSAVASAWADGFRNPPESATALGLSGGMIALVDDASAVAVNPANLTEVDAASTMLSATFVHTRTDYSGVSGSGSTREPWKILPNAFLAVPLTDGGAVGGLSITTPFGQSTEWDETGPFRYTAPYYAELRTVNVRPAVAVPLGDHFSLGAGVDVLWSDLDLRQYYPWVMATGNPMSPDGVARFTGEGTGVGGCAGLTWKIGGRHRLALTYRSSVRVEYDGDARIDNVPASGELPPPLRSATTRSDFETEIEFPAIWGLGYGLQLTDRIRVGADIERVEFSSYDTLSLDANENNVLLPSTESRQEWEDTWTFGCGVDWRVTDRVVLRAGYTYLQSPVPDDTLSPTLPDADRHVLSLGIGYGMGAHQIHVAGALSRLENRDISGNQNAAYNGTYETEANIVSVSYAYMF